MENIQRKMPWWKRIIYVFLLLVFLAIGANVWTWGISMILSSIISVISITMIYFFWGEIMGKKGGEKQGNETKE